MATLEVDRLLAEARWLRRLAHSLVRDPTEAADVEQETWAAALAARPDPARPLRPWLRTVLVNVIRMRGRGRGRLRPREEEFESARQAPPTPALLLERAELERRLAERVVALDEPYRTTVLLRYQEEMSAEQIAALQEVPAGTVRWRLKTALDRLRREMDETPRWRAVLLSPLSSKTGRLLVVKKSLAALALLVLLLAIGIEVARRAGSPAGVTGPAGRSAALPGARRAGGPAARALELARLQAQPGLPDRRLAGVVLFEGAPVAGARVLLALAEAGAPIAAVQSGADGSFDLGVHPAALYVVTATAPGRASRPLQADARDPTGRVDALEILLTACATLSGAVRDGAGGVVADAVVAHARGGPAARTGDDGRYQLCLPWGQAEIAFTAPGYGGVVIELEMNGPRRRDVALVPEAVVEGIVIRAEDGAPQPGALVEIAPNRWGAERGAVARGVADQAGRFSVAGVSAGRNRVTATTGDRLTASPVELVAEAGRTLDGVAVPVDAAFEIAGLVEAAGRPVAGARIRVAVAGMMQSHAAQAVSQANGRFAMQRVRGGELRFVVEGYELVSPLDLRLAAGARDLRVEVRPLAGVRGRVVRGGAPVAGAEVSCTDRLTGSDGRYECAGLAPGAHRLLARDASAWGPGPGGLSIELARGEVRTVDLELVHSASICGIVRDQAGAPVAGVDVELVQGGGDDSGNAQTAADGSFCAARLRGGGTYRPVVFLPGGRLHRLAPARPFPAVRVAGPAARVDGVELVVHREALAITGRVVDASGAPIADARVGAWPAAGAGGPPVFYSHLVVPSASTDQDGAFRIDDLPRADYALQVRGQGGSEAVVPRVAAGARGVVVTLAAAGRIEGRLVGFATPPEVLAIVTDYQRSPLDAQVSGDRFHIDAVPPGSYVLTAANGRDLASGTVRVRPGGTGALTLEARGRGVVDGHLTDRTSGRPVAGARCSALPRAGEALGNFYAIPDTGALSDQAGRFSIDGAPTGEIVVHCSRTATTTGALRAIALAPGQRLAVALEAVSSAGPEGTIAARLSPIELRVIALTPGGPADRAGLALGDQVVAVDDRPVAGLGPDGVLALITARPSGQAARITVERGGQRRTLAVTVEPASTSD